MKHIIVKSIQFSHYLEYKINAQKNLVENLDLFEKL